MTLKSSVIDVLTCRHNSTSEFFSPRQSHHCIPVPVGFFFPVFVPSCPFSFLLLHSTYDALFHGIDTSWLA